MSMAKESATLQEYFISGIVILFFGLLYLFLSDDFQWGSSKNNVLPTLTMTQSTFPASIHEDNKLVVDTSLEDPLNTLSKEPTFAGKTPAAENTSIASQSITSSRVSVASLPASVKGVESEDERSPRAMASKIDNKVDNKEEVVVVEQSFVQGDKSLLTNTIVEPEIATVNTDIDLATKKEEEKAIVDTQKMTLDAEGQVFKLPNGKEITIATNGFEHDFKQAIINGMTGKPIIFDRVYFDSGFSTLKQQSNQQIVATAALLNTYKDIKIAIRGHSDNKGSSQKNSLLSLLRSRSMKKALTDLGINAKRIQIEGVGDQEPIATNKTKRGRRNNRRIDLIIKKQVKEE